MSLSINNTDCRSLHFIGALGTGMSALAQFLRWEGLEISGSDRQLDDPATARVRTCLERIGCRLGPQDGTLVSDGLDAVVVSTAIEDSNPDMAQARSLGLPVLHRSDVLAAIIAGRRTIAVAGTSGKSTVTAMIFHCLRACGKDPSVISGAALHDLTDAGEVGNAWRAGSDLLVVEADESDGTLVKYRPYLSVFLNVSLDHKSVEEVVGLFGTLARQSEVVIKCADDPGLAAVPAAATYGTADSATLRAQRLDSREFRAEATIDGVVHGVPFPGTYMAMNLLATVAVCRRLGCPADKIPDALESYRGILRRFDLIATRAGVTVVDDFAHNPEKIRAAAGAAQGLASRVIMLFQPHGFGPMKLMGGELVKAFNEIVREEDTLYLLPIYYAGGTADKSISSEEIAAALTSCRGTVRAPQTRESAIELIASEVLPGDLVLSMGARDPSLPAFARSIAEKIDEKNVSGADAGEDRFRQLLVNALEANEATVLGTMLEEQGIEHRPYSYMRGGRIAPTLGYGVWIMPPDRERANQVFAVFKKDVLPGLEQETARANAIPYSFCPECDGERIEELPNTGIAKWLLPWRRRFRCQSCGHVWE